MPAHAHSDILSFDLFKNGEPLIVETGTSTYQRSFIREYERSARAHNLLLLSEDNINFLEPLEVWDSFRAARKYKILSRDNGIDENKIWVKCSFKPISKFLISQERCLTSERISDDIFELNIIDSIISTKKLFWNFYLHFAPNYDPNKLKIFLNEKLLNTKSKNFKWIESWTSFEYGNRILSRSLIISGKFDAGFNQNVIKLDFQMNWYMKRVWIINQFSNTNNMPGHTRQFDLANFLKGKGFLVSIFSSDFNLSIRKFLRKK